MTGTLLEAPAAALREIEEPQLQEAVVEQTEWLVFDYAPSALFSLKNSRATSTAGKTLLTPTPYAVKMAFLDRALCHGFVEDPNALVSWLAKASLRIGVPGHACVTGTIQTVRQETREVERKKKPDLPFYLSTVALREVVHYQGILRLAFDLKTCTPDLVALLIQLAPAIQYLGKRGCFMQYLRGARQNELDASFTVPLADCTKRESGPGSIFSLDDFGPGASFDSLNSFSAMPIKRGVHRTFVETLVPFETYNAGPGFTHYRLSAGEGEIDS